MNQVLLKLCKAHGKELVTTLSVLGAQPTVILGRMMQNARWCRKYKVPYHMTSGARTLWEQRDADCLRALERELLSQR
jgi:RNase P/RNase MRP subunit p30